MNALSTSIKSEKNTVTNTFKEEKVTESNILKCMFL